MIHSGQRLRGCEGWGEDREAGRATAVEGGRIAGVRGKKLTSEVMMDMEIMTALQRDRNGERSGRTAS